VLHLRGYRLPFWTPTARDFLIDWLAERAVSFLIVDPWARAFTGAGSENSNEDVGRVLDALDEIKRRAGVADLLVVAHTGRKEHIDGGEHVRGATRLDDWADTRWLITRDRRDRFFAAHGRGVEVEEGRLTFDPDTLRLSFTDGSRSESRMDRVLERVVEEV